MLIAGTVADALPLNVLAKEGEVLSGNTEASEDGSRTETVGEDKETTKDDTEPNPAEKPDPEEEGKNDPETKTETGEETGEEPLETEGAEEQLPQADLPELMGKPVESVVSVNFMRSVAQDSLSDTDIALGEGWVLASDGRLTIQSDTGMAGWTEHCENNPSDRYAVENVEISEDVTSIYEDAFYKCTNMTSVSIPVSVKSIGGSAFEECSSLTEITIPDGITSIGDSVFFGCKNLARISIPGSVTSIESNAFGVCENLTSITIPRNVTTIGYNAFDRCRGLTQVIMESETPPALDVRVFLDCKFVTDGEKGIRVPAGSKAVYQENWSRWAEYITDGTHDHNWSDDWTNNATHHWHECVEADCPTQSDAEKGEYGEHEYDGAGDLECNICGYQRTVEHIHTLTQKPAKDATCTETGNTAYYICNDCGKWFLDGAGNQEITNQNSVVIGAKGHRYDESTWGYKVKEGHARMCLDCGVYGDIQSHVPGEAATESTPQICTVCGYVITPATGGGSGNGGSDNNEGNSIGVPESGEGDASGGESGNSSGTGTAVPAPAVTSSTGTGQTRVKQEKEGNIRREVNVTGEETLDASVAMLLSELADIVLTGTERQQAADGTQIRIVLDVKDASDSVSATDRALVEEALDSPVARGYTLGQYLDINLYKVIGDSRNVVTETDGRIAVTIRVPERLRNIDSARMRIFAVLRVHNGSVELLTDLDTSEDTVTIATDRFSTYAIVYKDMAVQGGVMNVSAPGTGSDGNSSGGTGAKDSEPKTGDTTYLELYATLSMIAGLTYLLSYFTDRRHGMTEETKKEIVAHLVAWAKLGGRLRRVLALTAIFVVLVYYHSIGKKTCVAWKEVYGE